MGSEELYGMKAEVDQNTQELRKQDARLLRHAKRLDLLERNSIELPHAIEKAVSSGMQQVLTKVLEHEERFKTIQMEELEERAVKAEQDLKERAERKKYYTRAVVISICGCIVTSVLGGLLSFYLAVFLNNL